MEFSPIFCPSSPLPRVLRTLFPVVVGSTSKYSHTDLYTYIYILGKLKTQTYLSKNINKLVRLFIFFVVSYDTTRRRRIMIKTNILTRRTYIRTKRRPDRDRIVIVNYKFTLGHSLTHSDEDLSHGWLLTCDPLTFQRYGFNIRRTLYLSCYEYYPSAS